jgi:hypothetical protein
MNQGSKLIREKLIRMTFLRCDFNFATVALTIHMAQCMARTTLITQYFRL